ncbi:MAG TPA: biotin--[acetyl-CoA-carboxylase] ligase [Streptosporangiaceae bacterium]|nr:biotin--[acetyl-CoA-carboxylase] ligase [Streptosporangiaceae bacterium]
MPAARTDAPLDAERLRAALVGPGSLWTDVRVLARTGSTNTDALELALAGARQGLVIATEAQLSGRGRQGRSWVSLPGAALTFSVLLRPASVPQAVRGWLPLLAGVATMRALTADNTAALTGIEASLKWPNDVLAGDRKLAGILAEQSGDAIVVGIGLNVLGAPVATATSLELLAQVPDRNELLVAILREFGHWYGRWTQAGDAERSGLRAEYLRLCHTIGRQVSVFLPGGRILKGTAADVDLAGQLLVSTATGAVSVSAGDVIHVR